MKTRLFYKNKFLALPVLMSFVLLQSNISYALPSGQSVASGTATFNTSGSTETITASNRAIINYNTFNIAQPETVTFVQPSASSVVLNRVTGTAPSSILGTMNANGQVFLVNPNGILFGANSQVNAPGLLASTLDIANSDFLAGKYNFAQKAGSKASYVVNQGHMNIADNGFAVLLGGAVANSGTITANLGKVGLASGAAMTIALNNNISVAVNTAVANTVLGPSGTRMADAVTNSGVIQDSTASGADGIQVVLDADILNNIFDHAINNSGRIFAYANTGANFAPTAESVQLIANNNAGTSAVYPGIVLSGGSIVMQTNSTDNTVNLTISSNSGAQESGGYMNVEGLVTLKGAGTFGLQNVNNDISGSLAGNVNGVINYKQTGSLTIGAAGLVSNNYNVVLSTVADDFGFGAINLDGYLNAGTGNLTLNSEGINNNALGHLTAGGLTLTGTGDVMLTSTANHANTLTANVTGNIDYAQKGSLQVESLNSHNNNVTFNVISDPTQANQLFDILGTINAGTGNVAITSHINTGTDKGEESVNGVITPIQGSIIASNLSLNGNANYFLYGNVGTLTANVSGDSLKYTNAGALNVSSINAPNLVHASEGQWAINGVDIETVNGNLTVLNSAAANDINAGQSLILEAGGANHILTINSGAKVNVMASTTSGYNYANLYYVADNMNLVGLTQVAPSNQEGYAELDAFSANRSVALGGEVSGSLSLTNQELNTITVESLGINNETPSKPYTTGTVSLVGNVNLTHTSWLGIDSNNQILGTKGASLTATHVNLNAANGIGTSTTPLTIVSGDITATTTNGIKNIN